VAQKLIKIIEGSAVMKKIILDGSFATATFETTAVMVELFSKFESACKKKGIELWRKNWRTNNGKVDFGFENS
jgi:hypothetical protein